jgi:hypothetical protein
LLVLKNPPLEAADLLAFAAAAVVLAAGALDAAALDAAALGAAARVAAGAGRREAAADLVAGVFTLFGLLVLLALLALFAFFVAGLATTFGPLVGLLALRESAGPLFATFFRPEGVGISTSSRS